VRIGEDSTVAAKDHATGALGAGEHGLYMFNNFFICH
jgi:hypothetical protein